MSIFKSFYKSNKSICLILLGMSVVALPACEKSRLKVRPAIATTPKSTVQTKRPLINEKRQQPHYEDKYEPEVVVDVPTREHRRDVVRPSVREREHRAQTRREERPVSIDGIPVTTVKNHDSKKETVVNTNTSGADLNCQSKGCTPPPKKDDSTDLPKEDIPEIPKKDKPVAQEPVATEEPTKEPVIAEPTDNTRVSILDKSKSFDHFHLLLVIDRGAIHKNRLGKDVDNKAIEVQRNQVLETVGNFLEGFNKLRPMMIDNKNDVSFTLGLVAGSNDPNYVGKYFNNTKKEFNTKDISGVQKLINGQLDILAQDKLDPDKTHPITVNSNFVSLKRFIESDPASINGGTKFLSENIPTVVLTIGNVFSDRCTIRSTYPMDEDCSEAHNYGDILKTLIKRKVYGSNTVGIFAPVTFKHIFLNGRDGTIQTYFRDHDQSDGEPGKRIDYDAQTHGARFAARTLVDQIVDKPSVDFTEASLIINGRYDEGCLVDKDNKYITTTSIGVSKAEVEVFDQTASDLPADRMCKILESSEFNDAIVEKLYKDELELLED